MSYTRTTWENGVTPLNAINMNNIEDGIAELNTRISGLIDIFYPVGSYYETSDASFDPNNAWGGTWSLETAGKVHIGAGTGYTLGSTGGNKDAIIPYHRHDVAAVDTDTANISHTHSLSSHTHYAPNSAGYVWVAAGSSHAAAIYNDGSYTGGPSNNTSGGMSAHATDHKHSVPAHNTAYAGTDGNVTDANMQPYIVVNRWHRTA